MLFLDTCIVEAGVNNWTSLIDTWVVSNGQISPTFSFRVVPSETLFDLEYLSVTGSGTESGTSYTTTGSYSGRFSFTLSNQTVVNGVNYYSYHVTAPCNFNFSPSTTIEPNDYYGWVLSYSALSVGGGVNVSNFALKDSDGSTFAANLVGNVLWLKGRDILSGQNDGSVGRVGYIDFDVTFSEDYVTVASMPTYHDFTIQPTLVLWCGHMSDSYEESVQVSDTVTQQELSEMNDTAEDTNTKITDFFGSFFDNLLHIFVPEDGYFSTWFDKVNTLLSDKLGMLYAPFDLVISTLQAIYNADSTESGIPFPGIKWDNTWLVEPFTFTFASLGESFDELREKVYFATDTVLVFTFLLLLQSKVKLILEGHE